MHACSRWRRLRRAPRAVLVTMVPLFASACSDEPQESCPGPDSYRIYVGARTPGQECTIALSAGDHSASYLFPAVKSCASSGDQPTCTPAPGSPPPSSCQVLACALVLEFYGPPGPALVSYLGQKTFTMTATCGGTLLESNEIHADTACRL